MTELIMGMSQEKSREWVEAERESLEKEIADIEREDKQERIKYLWEHAKSNAENYRNHGQPCSAYQLFARHLNKGLPSENM